MDINCFLLTRSCIRYLKTRLQALLITAALFGLLVAVSCGGGGSSAGTPPPPPPTPDFQLAVSPTTQALVAGGSSSVSLSATALNGFSSQISVQVTGQQGGVTVSPQNFILTPGTPQSITLTAAANTPTSSVTVDLAGSSGSLAHSTQLALSVSGSYSGPPVRTRYVRTDATTIYSLWLNQHWEVYDSVTARFFVTDPFSNHVFVLDDVTESEVGSISVPGAYGIDEAPDHSALYVGTLLGDVYVIDPASMVVTHRYLASQIGPSGFQAWVALALADGRLALLSPVDSSAGASSYALWDPANNSISVCASGTCGGGNGISGFTTSVDRTKLIVGTIFTNGPLSVVDTTTGQAVSGTAFDSSHILASPDGKYIILPGSNSDAVVYDSQTLSQVADISVSGDTSSASGFAISADSTTLYTSGNDHGGFVYAYSLPAGTALGWVPDMVVIPQGGGAAVGPIATPYLLAVDGTGLFAGPLEEGVGFVDVTALHTGSGATQFENGYLVPTTGPVSGGTATQNVDPNPVGTLKSVYFGSQQATNLFLGPQFAINATTPSGLAGPVDVYNFTADGGMQLLPEAFSYGPTILQVTPNIATQEGGGTGYIYGYGFGGNATGVPSDLQVTVTGMPATITSYNYFGYPGRAAPYPMELLTYTIPPGTAGATDIAVTTSSGSTTSHAALTYIPSTQQFPLPGSQLAQGIYDAHRGVYYFTDLASVQVFSRTQGKWLSPIALPPPQGAIQRLWGISLSPNGSQLAVSDASAGVIYLLNPSNPTSVKTFAVQVSNPAGNLNPSGLAVSDSGIVYYAMFGGGTGYYKLNTNTGTITNYETGPASQDGSYQRVVIASDNSTVFFNSDGHLASLDTASDVLTQAPSTFCCGNNELSLSNDQLQLLASSYLYDKALNPSSFYALNDREIQYTSYVYGAKMSADGRFAFQPSTSGIDLMDGTLGNLLQRVSLPFSLSTNYDALVDDGQDNVLAVITGANGSGIAIVDLSSIPEPPILPYNKRAFQAQRLIGAENYQQAWQNQSTRSSMAKGSAAVRLRTVPHVTKSFRPITK